MYGSQTNIIRGLAKAEYAKLRFMCQRSNSLYNSALYNIRQHYERNGKYLSYQANDKACQENINYRMIQATASQQILRAADASCKSFFALKKKGGDLAAHAEFPHYRKKGGFFMLIFPRKELKWKTIGGKQYVRIPMSRKFTEEFGKESILIPLPERIAFLSVHEIRIYPSSDGQFFRIKFIYEQPDVFVGKPLDPRRALGIDPGIDNLAACSLPDGTSFLIDGRYLKSVNHRWNESMARLKSEADREVFPHDPPRGHVTHRMIRETEKRNRRQTDYLRKAARYVVEYCLREGIGTVVFNRSIGWKCGINIGKVNNRNFVQIAHGEFRTLLSNLCKRYGIRFLALEESYTSKASAADGDYIPTYKAGVKNEVSFSGRRIYRGLYKTKTGITLNADVNGALNGLRKCKQNGDADIDICDASLCKGRFGRPERIRLV